MIYLHDTWYVAAWSDEITRAPLARTLLGQPVVLYRCEDGSPAAIGGRCPHRFAPLAGGTLLGDALECPYHGLRFGPSGACVHNPHGAGVVPNAARVPRYAIAEGDGLVWMWGGEVDRADESCIPRLSHLVDPALGTVRGYLPMQANYELGVDNLIDLSHTQFVHGDTLFSARYSAATTRVSHEGDTVTVTLWIPNSAVPGAYVAHVKDPEAPVDYWLDATWRPPAIVLNDVGVSPVGAPREQGVRSTGTHILTPETEHTAHYFFAHSRNTKIDDAGFDEQIRRWHRVGFGEQDKVVIEAAAAMMGAETDPLRLGAILLPTDSGAVRVRRMLARLIDDEQATRHGRENSA